MVADGNCRFRAVTHIVHGRESVWSEVRQRLLDLDKNPAGYFHDVVITPGVVQSLQACLVGPIWDRSKWFHNDKHAQMAADAYGNFVVMVTYDYSNVVIRVSSSFQCAEAIRQQSPQALGYGI